MCPTPSATSPEPPQYTGVGDSGSGGRTSLHECRSARRRRPGDPIHTQQDASTSTIAEIAEEVDVSASTVRNRIEAMEESGVIEGYFPKLDYERPYFPLHVLFVCTAPAGERE